MGTFTFKKFSVCDDRATMKVGTDAVLLGAWTAIEAAKTILDIGSGSGIIALMLAQRSSEGTTIDAVELQSDDARQAAENIQASPWPVKVSIINTRIQDYHPARQYDLVVCNPPFFSNSLLPPTEERTMVRHQSTLSQEDLVAATLRLMLPQGRLGVIMPPVEGGIFIQNARAGGLYPHRITRFYTRAGKPQERSLMEFGFSSSPAKEDSLILYDAGGQWTEDYRVLTREFYLER